MIIGKISQFPALACCSLQGGPFRNDPKTAEFWRNFWPVRGVDQIGDLSRGLRKAFVRDRRSGGLQLLGFSSAFFFVFRVVSHQKEQKNGWLKHFPRVKTIGFAPANRKLSVIWKVICRGSLHFEFCCCSSTSPRCFFCCCRLRCSDEVLRAASWTWRSAEYTQHSQRS